ncbi:hypothetical protein B0H13DRAFT_1896089 [Mycena leptocephala]|nr:hypothetical protein B0H13DRAFT_1896089 [Mycena leptocephala]
MQRVRVSRGAWHPMAKLHGIFERACVGPPRRWMASGGDGGEVRNEERVPRPLQPTGVVIPGACAVWASMVAEIERSQLREAEKATWARGTLSACAADTGGGRGRGGMAQVHRSSSDGGTGAMMLAGPGDLMNERAPSTREHQRRHCACTWGRGSYVGGTRRARASSGGLALRRTRARWAGRGHRWRGARVWVGVSGLWCARGVRGVCVWYGVRDAASWWGSTLEREGDGTSHGREYVVGEGVWIPAAHLQFGYQHYTTAPAQIWEKIFMLSVFSREINAEDARLVLSINEKDAQGRSYSSDAKGLTDPQSSLSSGSGGLGYGGRQENSGEGIEVKRQTWWCKSKSVAAMIAVALMDG